MNNYLVYKHTSPAGKMYIGITNDYARRSKRHNYDAKSNSSFAFHKAIRKYGWSAFKHEIIADGLTQEEAFRIEVLMIKELNTMAPNGYNLTIGGDGVVGVDSAAIRKGQVANRKDTVKMYYYDPVSDHYNVRIKYLNSTLSFGSFKLEPDAKDKADYLMTLSDDQLLMEHSAWLNAKVTNTKGYYYDKVRKVFRVKFQVNGKSKSFGSYKSEQEAIDRVKEVRQQLLSKATA